MDMKIRRVLVNFSVICRVFLIIAGIVVFTACGNKAEKNDNIKTIAEEQQQDKLLRIDVESIVENVQDVNLSDIASDIEYIPLELKGDKYLKKCVKVEFTESYIFVCDYEKLFQFTRDGKFIRQVGCIGRGPGEYTGAIEFAANEVADLIMLQCDYGFYRYDMFGNFKGDIKGLRTLCYIIKDDKEVAYYKKSHINQLENLVVADLDMNSLHSFRNNSPRPETKSVFGIAPLYTFNNSLFFKEHYNDTVFEVQEDRLIPHMLLNESSLLFPKDFELKGGGGVASLIKQMNKVKNKINPHHMFESTNEVLISYIRGINPREQTRINILFDKRSKQGVVLKDGHFINDIDGGDNFWPNKLYKDTLMIKGVEALKLMAYVASDAFKNSTPKYPEKKKALEKLANGLSENDNPVLMLVRLRE
ncbi:6-bladed beta-propeller [Puteibacter caeruleilacunae]|nr:6-bladed beta-propeller [Puteibacter caeruleilacunae]